MVVYLHKYGMRSAPHGLCCYPECDYVGHDSGAVVYGVKYYAFLYYRHTMSLKDKYAYELDYLGYIPMTLRGM